MFSVHWPSSKKLAFVTLLLLFIGGGCATVHSGNTDGQLSYMESARKNFDKAEKALANKDYEEAVSYFDHVRRQYPYSKYAALSDLRVADTFFQEEKWLQAADAYEFFIRFHPRHENVADAWFKLSTSYFKAIPESFFIFPPDHTKDQTHTQEALQTVNRFLQEFPKHEKAAEALQMKLLLHTKLAKQNMAIAQFYAARKKWAAALYRYEMVANLYPDATAAPLALFAAFQIAHNQLKDKSKAEKFAHLLKQHYGQHELAGKAQALLRRP